MLLVTLAFGQEINLYLIGDAGEPSLPNDPTFDYLNEVTEEATAHDVLIFLGDNLYPAGLPSHRSYSRERMEQKLVPTLEAIKKFKGRSFIIPGNHDWADSGPDGWNQLMNMQSFVDHYLDDRTVFIPRNGCPGPIEVNLSPDLLLIIMDTQYLLHRWEKPGENSNCLAKSSSDAIILLDDLLSRNKDKNIVVAAHHPLYSFGPHGSKYTLRQHLFPLTDANRKLWIPLPVIGSIYPVFRSVFGSRQDISNPRYKLIRNTLVKSLQQVDDLVWVSGHEHSLQYIPKDSLHFVVSGSGSKTSVVRTRNLKSYTTAKNGFAKLTYDTMGTVNLKFFDGPARKEIWNKDLFNRVITAPEPVKDFDFEDSVIVQNISDQYSGASRSKQYWLGTNYRKTWGAPVEMPVFNIGREHGGLKIVKLGGGNQTKSLRLEAENGRQYVLRSLDKFTDKLLPSTLYGTLAADILQDQISSANPYGAFAIPPMADAVGIYHTNPKLVVVPDDPRFGKYQGLFAGLPVLYEERPNDEAATKEFFGDGEDIEGTPDLVEILHEDNDEQVDEPFTLKNRLFDMIIGDWDRHEDQWRWVSVDREPKGHYWRPIPRDRDQVFFENDGLFGWAVSRKFALPNTEGFNDRMEYPPGFNASARFFDRTFLTSLDWTDWQKQIEELQTQLTDEVIENAIKVWPDTIQKLTGAEIVQTLKARRDDMPRFARIYYEFLSKEVEVVGSDKHEYFLVDRISDNQTRVMVRKRNKDDEVLEILYDRTFDHEITKEVRLYGLEGEDIFEVKGEVNKGLKIRIIGGENMDTIRDQSNVKGLGKHTLVYDLKNDTYLVQSKETNSELDDDIGVNLYNRTAFTNDKFIPLISAAFNFDDGIFLGAGFIYKKQAWRKYPYAQKHHLNGNAAFATGAINLEYHGRFVSLIGWDLNVDLELQRPYGVMNFFGFGNETEFDTNGDDLAAAFPNEIDFYRTRYERSKSFISIGNRVGQNGYFKFGAEHLSYELEGEVNGRFINQYFSSEKVDSLKQSQQFLGVRAEIEGDTRNFKSIPTRGVYATATYAKYYGLNERSTEFSAIDGSFSFYLSTASPERLTVANRVGFKHVIGDVEFYNGADLGRANLRGYRRGRFIGNSSAYHSLDLRLRILSFRTYLFPGTIGLIGFHDIGRVWYPKETSGKWHRSQGAGVWIAPLNQFALVFNMAFTEDENLPSVSLGFQF
ncbi:MAG: metallophosphoesterase [Marinoscillum sp.]